SAASRQRGHAALLVHLLPLGPVLSEGDLLALVQYLLLCAGAPVSGPWRASARARPEDCIERGTLPAGNGSGRTGPTPRPPYHGAPRLRRIPMAPSSPTRVLRRMGPLYPHAPSAAPDPRVIAMER